MHIVILAAGRGSRLGNLDYPKALTPLTSDQTIFDRQVSLLKKQFPKASIVVVVGYRKELIMQQYSQLNFVENDNYAHENTAKSLLKALKNISDDVLWLNGDVVFHPSVLNKFIKKTSMFVNEGTVGEEEVKFRRGADGLIKEISKEVKQGEGEAVGINYFLSSDIELLKKALDACSDKDYFEKAIEICIKNGMQVLPVTIPRDHCAEIDFPEDLEHARHLIQSWTI